MVLIASLLFYDVTTHSATVASTGLSTCLMERKINITSIRQRLKTFSNLMILKISTSLEGKKANLLLWGLTKRWSSAILHLFFISFYK